MFYNPLMIQETNELKNELEIKTKYFCSNSLVDNRKTIWLLLQRIVVNRNAKFSVVLSGRRAHY